jgi:two-component system sensor histidine kinase MprB
MLTELDASRQQQRQLVTDASHELRTPLTSLRTNVEMLARSGDLPHDERKQILDDAQFEINELTKIVGELVELATDVQIEERERQDVRLDDIVRGVVDRARRRTSLRIDLHAEPTLVVGNPELLERATGNLVDNATKWSPREGVIEVSVSDGTVTVRDQGPGIPAQDLPHVFERFYRSEDARSKPGSGLGLAIVKQIVEAHEGTVRAENLHQGGALVGFRLPPVPLDAP